MNSWSAKLMTRTVVIEDEAALANPSSAYIDAI